jgi:hypothetical protein
MHSEYLQQMQKTCSAYWHTFQKGIFWRLVQSWRGLLVCDAPQTKSSSSGAQSATLDLNMPVTKGSKYAAQFGLL